MTAEHQLWQQALSKAKAVSVQNVMNPLLWLNAVAIPLLIGAAYLFNDDALLSRVFAVAASVVPLWTLYEYSCWRKNDPARLHSERYLIEHQQLMIQSKSTSVAIPASTLPSSDNPETLVDYTSELTGHSTLTLPSAEDEENQVD